MKPSRHKLVRRFFALAVVAYLAIGLAGASLLDVSGRFASHSGYAEAANAHSVRIEAETMLFDRPLLIVERATVSMLAPNGRALNDAEIAAKLQDGTADLVMDDAKLLLDASGLHPARTSSVPDAVKPVLASINGLSFKTLKVNDAKLMHRAAVERTEQLAGRLSCEISRPETGVLRAVGTIERNGVALPFDVTLKTKNANTAGGRLGISAKLAGPFLNASISGEFVRGDVPHLSSSQTTATSPHLKEVLRWFGGEAIDGNGLEDFRVGGPMEWTGQTIAFQGAKFTIDGNQASGNLSVNFAGDRPTIDGTLGFDNLELAPYLGPSAGSLAGLTQHALGWSRWLVGGPATASLIRDLDADVRLSATSVTTGGATLGRGAASVVVKDRKFSADLAEIDLDQEAQGNGRVSIDLSGPVPKYDIHGMLEAPDLATATRVFTDRKIVSGSGRLDIALTASGVSDTEFRQSLSGSATLSMPDGGRLAFDLASLLAAAKTGGLGWDQIGEGTTNVETLDAKLQAASGVFTASEVQAQTSNRTVQVAGTIDLPNQVVDLSIASSPRDASSTADDSAKERVRIRGPLLAPAIKAESHNRADLFVTSPQR